MQTEDEIFDKQHGNSKINQVRSPKLESTKNVQAPVEEGRKDRNRLIKTNAAEIKPLELEASEGMDSAEEGKVDLEKGYDGWDEYDYYEDDDRNYSL